MAHLPYVAVPQKTYDRYHIHTHKLAFFYSIPDKYSLSHQSPKRSKTLPTWSVFSCFSALKEAV